jgi:hypothetical protein
MSNWNNEVLANPVNKSPKEIFNAYCDELGAHYNSLNFKFYKSRPRIERQANELVESIHFWSSRNNEANNYVHLEILPYIKSKSLKKWIKVNGIGRNEFLYSLKVDYPRNIGIFDHDLEDFKKLTQEIDRKIISKFKEVTNAILNAEIILETDKFDDGLITDNFLAYLCMQESKLVEEALDKYGHNLNEKIKARIKNRKAS